MGFGDIRNPHTSRYRCPGGIVREDLSKKKVSMPTDGPTPPGAWDPRARELDTPIVQTAAEQDVEASVVKTTAVQKHIYAAWALAPPPGTAHYTLKANTSASASRLDRSASQAIGSWSNAIGHHGSCSFEILLRSSSARLNAIFPRSQVVETDMIREVDPFTDETLGRLPNGHVRWDPKTKWIICGPWLPRPSVQEMANAGRSDLDICSGGIRHAERACDD